MSQRFFVETPITNDRAELVESEAHHLLHVMRASVGDEIVLFDGTGAEYVARVAQLKRSSAQLEVLSRQEIDRESSVSVTLGVALPKGDRQKWLVEKITELGVQRLIPLSTRRGVAQPEASAIDRLRRSVIEASKQCGRNRLMEISPAQSLVDFLSQPPADAQRIIAHPFEPTAESSANDHPSKSDHHYWIAIGPEGGFADEEVTLACAQHWRCCSLGKSILRVETAAIGITAAVSMNVMP